MIHNIHTLNYIVTDTKLDGFIEECHLIKEIKPRYNKQQGASYLSFGGAPCFCSAGLRVATSASKELF